MIYRIAYLTPEKLSFVVDIEAPDEERARLTWQHRHPAAFGYSFVSIVVASDVALAHLHWEDYAAEYAPGARSPLVRSVEMGLMIVIIFAYVVTITGGTALGLWLGAQRSQQAVMPMGFLGLGLGIVVGYVCNVVLDWMRVMMTVQSAQPQSVGRHPAGSPHT